MAVATPAHAESLALSSVAGEPLGASFEHAARQVSADGTTRRCVPSYDDCDPCRCYRESDRWHFGIQPYGWLADVSGTAYTDGQGTDFEVPFEEMLERTNGGFQLYMEARYKRWYFAFDGTWANLGDLVESRFVSADVEVEQWILDFRVGYRIGRWVTSRRPAHFGTKPCHTINLFLFTGLRYFKTDTTVDLTLPVVGPRRIELSDETTDPLLGARITADLAPRWSIDLRGEVAALGTDKDIMSWETSAYVYYSITRWLAFSFGWRVMGMDMTSGSGPTKNGAEVVNHGPLIGVAFIF